MLASKRTRTGQYIIYWYDYYGGRLRYKETAETLTEATTMAKLFLAANAETKSYTIDRRLFNSLDSEASL
jgi:hypothetical protein